MIVLDVFGWLSQESRRVGGGYTHQLTPVVNQLLGPGLLPVYVQHLYQHP